METSIQNGALAAAYAVLFWLILRHPLRRDMWLFLIACGVATLYNIAYDCAIHFRVIMSIALFVRLLPPIEACWRRVGRRKDCKSALILLLGAVLCRLLLPPVHYLAARVICTVGVTIVCIMVRFAGELHLFEMLAFWRRHLILQTAWMLLHSAFTLTAPWYNATWERRGVARWLYVIASLLIVLGYRRLLEKPPQAAEEIQQ